MKYFKDENNEVYAFEADGSQDDFIGKNLIPITETEARAITSPSPTPEQLQAITNAEARAYLSDTDWYVARFAETGVAIPPDVMAARQAARESIV
jgi:hypothetical protein